MQSSSEDSPLEWLLQSAKLPTLPSVAIELIELANDPESELAQFIDAVERANLDDVILEAANSPLIGCQHPFESVEQAVSFLGQARTISKVVSQYLDEDQSSWPLKKEYDRYLSASVNRYYRSSTTGQDPPVEAQGLDSRLRDKSR